MTNPSPTPDERLIESIAYMREQLSYCDLSDPFDAHLDAVVNAAEAALTSPAWSFDMDAAPHDGHVIEAVGRHPNATAGFPMYVDWMDGAWHMIDFGPRQKVVCWAWRERCAGWPAEPPPPSPTPDGE